MAVEDIWDSPERWQVYRLEGGMGWRVAPPFSCLTVGLLDRHTFAEAHAAYLDAVTCPVVPPLWGWGRCQRARGHRGQHRHAHLSTQAGPLLYVNQK